MESIPSAWFSDEVMLASIDPVKKHNMSRHKRMAAEFALDLRLSRASWTRGRIRSEFQEISYSDYKNLLAYASKYIKFPYLGTFSPFWVSLVEELQLIVQEYETSPAALTSKQTNSDLVHSQVLKSSEIAIGDDRITFPIPIPIPLAEQIANGSYQNSGEQHLRGLINNQTGNVSGNGNGSYIVTVMKDCKFSLTKGNQMAD